MEEDSSKSGGDVRKRSSTTSSESEGPVGPGGSSAAKQPKLIEAQRREAEEQVIPGTSPSERSPEDSEVEKCLGPIIKYLESSPEPSSSPVPVDVPGKQGKQEVEEQAADASALTKAERREAEEQVLPEEEEPPPGAPFPLAPEVEDTVFNILNRSSDAPSFRGSPVTVDEDVEQVDAADLLPGEYEPFDTQPHTLRLNSYCLRPYA